MSHLHLPDGTLPWWLWLSALAVMLVLVLCFLVRLQERRRLLPAVAVLAAVSLVAMNIPLGLPIHMNLAALAGIVLGPGLGFLAVFIVNLFNALVGHGGITMLGVNCLLVGSEALAAGLVFLALGGARRLLANSALAVIAALLISTLLTVGVAGIAGGDLEALVHADHGHEAAGNGGHFLATFLKIIAPLAAIWIALELTVSLLVVGYVNKVRGGWFRGD